MQNDHLFSVTITQGEKDSNGHDSFEVCFEGDGPDAEHKSVVRSSLRLASVNDQFVFINIVALEFENVSDEDKVQLALLVPDGFVKLWGLHKPNAAVFEKELSRTIPYLHEVTTELISLNGGRIAVPAFIEEANGNMLSRGYHFKLAPKEEPVLEESVIEQVLPQLSVHETAAPTDESPAALKMRIGFDGKQVMLVGNNPAALGQAVVADYRHKQNGEKFEVVAVDTIQVIGMDTDVGLGLTYGALSLTKRFSPDLPLEIGMTKPGLELLSETIPDLTENSKWSSHLNLFLLNEEYVRSEIARIAAMGYVADLEE